LDLELRGVHVTAKISMTLIMVLQAQVSKVIDDGKSVKYCKNEEFGTAMFFILYNSNRNYFSFRFFI
jgi:hypothetical protein